MPLPLMELTALALPDGSVFVIDDEVNAISDLGGPPHPSRPTALLDPATGGWTASATLERPRSLMVAVALHDGRVLVTGGDNGWYRSYSSTKLFDPGTGAWTSSGLLGTARRDPIGAVLADGRVLVAGGVYSEGYSGLADWERDQAGGGEGVWRPEVSLTSAELWDPATGRWAPTGSLDDPASAGTAFALPDGRVLAVGSEWSDEPVPVEVYDPATGRWSAVGRVVRPQGSAAVVLDDGSLLIVGGLSAGDFCPDIAPLATVIRLDPSTGATTEVAPLPAPRSGAAAVLLRDGRVLVVGGTERPRSEWCIWPPSTATSFIYDPGGDTWAEGPSMPFADDPGAAVLLDDGSVVVIGGTIPIPEAIIDAPQREPVPWTARLVLEPGS